VKPPPTFCLFQEMTESCILHLYFNDEGCYTSNSFSVKSQLTVFSKSYTYLHFGDVMALVFYWLKYQNFIEPTRPMFLTTLLKICRTASVCSWHNGHQWKFVFLCVFILIKFHIGMYIKSWYMDFLLVCISQIQHQV